jgi:hypothetical protein
MTENVENLMFKHVKCSEATLERVERRVGELATRQTETHVAALGLRRDQVKGVEISAHQQVQLDAVKDRLDRIKRRLELND